MRFTFTRDWVDTDGMLRVFVSFERGDGYDARQDVYLYPTELAEFGRRLRSFPSSVTDEVSFRVGAKDHEGYSALALRAYVFNDSGHTALQVSLWGNPAPELRANFDASVPVEAATLNRLGEELEAWALNNDEPFEFPGESSS